MTAERCVFDTIYIAIGEWTRACRNGACTVAEDKVSKRVGRRFDV